MNKFPKLQQGGGFDSLFTIYKPIQTESPRRTMQSSGRPESKREKDDSDKGKLTEKDLFQMLKDLDGLPNDMQQLVVGLSTTLRNAQLLGVEDVGFLANNYLQNLYKLKQAKFNKEQYDEAYKRAVKNGSLNDIAITINGAVLVQDKDEKITALSPEQWAKAKESGQYQPLTNSNLLWLRAHNPGWVNNNKVLQTVENGIGLEQVHKMIKARFHKIGSTEVSTDQFVPKEAVKGAQILEQMLSSGPEGYYKITQEMTKTEDSQVKAALYYIYSTLPANARTRLALETADGTKDSAIGIISSMILGTVESKNKYSAQYIGTKEKLTSSGKGKNGIMDNGELNTAIKWLQGYGNKESFVINLGSSSSYLVQSTTMPLVKMNGDYLGVNSTLQQVSEGQYSPILDLRSVSMGMKLIDPAQFNQILLTDGKISSIDFPCIEQNGVVMPDLSRETRVAKERADAQIRQRGISLSDEQSVRQNYQVINQIYQDNGLPAAYNSDGTLITARWRRFGVINGKAWNGALGMDYFESNSLLEEDTNDANIQNYVSTIKKEDWDDSSWLGLSGVDHLYKGTIWIPVQVNYHAAAASMKMSPNEAQALEERQQALEMQNRYQKPPQIP